MPRKSSSSGAAWSPTSSTRFLVSPHQLDLAVPDSKVASSPQNSCRPNALSGWLARSSLIAVCTMRPVRHHGGGALDRHHDVDAHRASGRPGRWHRTAAEARRLACSRGCWPDTPRPSPAWRDGRHRAPRRRPHRRLLPGLRGAAWNKPRSTPGRTAGAEKRDKTGHSLNLDASPCPPWTLLSEIVSTLCRFQRTGLAGELDRRRRCIELG